MRWNKYQEFIDNLTEQDLDILNYLRGGGLYETTNL